jgi:hypothetical protein
LDYEIEKAAKVHKGCRTMDGAVDGWMATLHCQVSEKKFSGIYKFRIG